MLFCVLGGDSSWYRTFICIVDGQDLVWLMLGSLQGVPDLKMGLLMILQVTGIQLMLL